MNSPFQQDRIAAAKIMVVGCGALGNEVLKNLALMGAEHLTLVDFDRVVSGNLSRSVLFTRADAEEGRNKVDVAAERLVRINPRISVKTVCGDIAFDVGLGLVRQAFRLSTGDAVLLCVGEMLPYRGESFNGIGLEPDVAAAAGAQTATIQKDSQFLAAVAVLRGENQQTKGESGS